MKHWIAPSILAADFAALGDAVNAVAVDGAEWVHVDVMDGHFVPNLTIGAPVVKSLRQATDRYLDCHLMVTDPHRYFDDFVKAGADGITFHAEATVPLRRTDETLDALEAHDVKRGMSISPDTNVDMVAPWIDRLDLVLVMSVYPGFGGQKFLERVLPKVERLRELGGDDLIIQIDGGITVETIGAAAAAGVNSFVAGTSVFGAPDPAAAVGELLGACT